ncbi:MAG: glycosyl hydrolase family 28 protein [Polyangiaceae bacterium]
MHRSRSDVLSVSVSVRSLAWLGVLGTACSGAAASGSDNGGASGAGASGALSGGGALNVAGTPGAGGGASSASGAPGAAGSNGSLGVSGASAGGAPSTIGGAPSTSSGGSNTGTGGSSAGRSSVAGSAGRSSVGSAGAAGSAPTTGCGAGDTKLPAEPTIPAACSTLQASQHVATDGVPAESNFDTTPIQDALNACASGKAVKLAASAGKESFITGPLTIPKGVSLWVDTGATLFGTRNPTLYGSASALITVKGAGSGIVGDGVIDGQGGEPMVGSSSSFWDQNGAGGDSPALIQVAGATNFTLYKITLHNAPKFHVKLNAAGFVVWGVTIITPSKPKNSVGTALTVTTAHNTDGVDPGESASNGFIVCNKISTGDDHIAIKGSSSTGVTNLTIAHNRFGAGHGMSIGSEFTGGVSHVSVYDLSIDGSLGGYANGIRIKSDSSRGGLVNDVTYSDVCVRDLQSPILLTPTYSTNTGSDIPQYTNIKIQNFHALSGPSDQAVTLDGYDAAHQNSVFLDNVIVDGLTAANATGSYTNVTTGPGNVSFKPTGTGVVVTNTISGTSTPNPCTDKWTTF